MSFSLDLQFLLCKARVMRLPVILAIAALCSTQRNGATKGLDYSASLDQKWLAMAFGMPGANLSSQSEPDNAAKNSQLDILACGMPKTFQQIFL